MDRLQMFATSPFPGAGRQLFTLPVRRKEGRTGGGMHERSPRAQAIAISDDEVLEWIEDPERYSNQVFVKEPIEKVKSTYTMLEKQKHSGTESLKKNVYHNYPVLISTSKIIGEMESDMLEIQGCLQEFQGTIKFLQQIQHEEPTKPEETTPSTPRDFHRGTVSGASGTVASSHAIREISKTIDELDLLIKIRKYGGAVELLGTGRQDLKRLDPNSLAAAIADKTAQFNQKENDLINHIAKDLQNPTITKSETQKMIALLQNLSQERKARDIFLRSRSGWIKREVRHIKFSGDILSYASELSRITFAAIASTCQEFQSYFADKQMFSSFVVWVVREVQEFGYSFNRQVFHSDDFELMARCTSIPKVHCEKLQQYGLDLMYTLDPIFSPSLCDAISQYMASLKSTLSKQVEDEVWHAKECRLKIDEASNREVAVKVTESTRYLLTTLATFLKEIGPLSNLLIYHTILNNVSSMIDWYLSRLQEFSLEAMNDTQVSGFLANIFYLTGDATKWLESELKDMFARPVFELQAIIKKQPALFAKLAYSFVEMKATEPVQAAFGDACITRTISDGTEKLPSKAVIQFFTSLTALEKSLISSLPSDFVRSILHAYGKYTAKFILESQVIFDPTKLFRSGPILQLWVDIAFFSRGIPSLFDKEGQQLASEILEKYNGVFSGDSLPTLQELAAGFTKTISSASIRFQSI